MIIIGMIFLLQCAESPVQEADSTSMLQESSIAETILQEGDLSETDLTDDLSELTESHYLFSTITYEELQGLPFVTPILARRILDLRDAKEDVDSTDLARLDGMTEEMMTTIAHAISFDGLQTKEDRKTASLPGRWSIQTTAHRISRTSNYENRIIYEQTGFEGGAAIRKIGDSPQRSLLRSGYLVFRTSSILRKVIVGSFHVSFGHGLLFSRARGGFKSLDPAGYVNENGSGLRPYRGFDTSSAFHGIGAEADLDALGVSVFVATAPGSVLTDESSVYDQLIRVANPSGGLLVVGSDICYAVCKRFLVGFSSAATTQKMLSSESVKTEGMLSYLFSSYQNLTADGIHVFNEVAGASGCLDAWKCGLIVNPGRHIALSAHHLYTGEDFSHPFSRCAHSPARKSTLHSSFLGIETRTRMLGRFMGYCEETSDKIQEGFEYPRSEYGLSWKFATGKSSLLSLRYKRRTEEFSNGNEIKNDSSGAVLEHRNAQLRDDYRIQFEMRFLRDLTINENIAFTVVTNTATQKRETGFCSSVTARIDFARWNLSCTAGLTLFDTPSYDSRLYDAERTLPGLFSNPPLYETGYRTYLMTTWLPVEGCFISFRYRTMKKADEKCMQQNQPPVDGEELGTVQLGLKF